MEKYIQMTEHSPADAPLVHVSGDRSFDKMVAKIMNLVDIFEADPRKKEPLKKAIKEQVRLVQNELSEVIPEIVWDEMIADGLPVKTLSDYDKRT